MSTLRAELLAQKHDLEQKIALIDACLTTFCNYAVFSSEFLVKDRIFDNFKDAYDYVAKNNRSLDRYEDKWYRDLLSIVEYQWTDADPLGTSDPDLVYPDIWDKQPNGSYLLNHSVYDRDCVIHSPFSSRDYQPNPESIPLGSH